MLPASDHTPSYHNRVHASEADLTVGALSPDVVGQRIGEEFVLIHLGTNQIYRFNQTAARVWELLASGIRGTDLIARLTNEFAVDERELAAELEPFLAEMAADGLLVK